jgi:ParB-like nuclease domain/DNA methylase
MLPLEALSRKEPTRLEVIMVQANQSGDLKKSTALHAGATPARKTKGDVTRSFQDRDKSGRAGTRTDEPNSYRAKGVGKRTIVPIDAIRADPRNPRKHSRVQVRAIARSIDAFGFNAPILVDKQNQIVAGHGRYEAAQLLGLDRLPVISLDHLTETQARAYLLADNKLAERSSWDDASLALQLKELSELALDFDFKAIGFELPEVDLRIQSLDPTDNADRADEFRNVVGPAVTRPGDLWLLGKHRVYCGSALDPLTYELLMTNEKAGAAFTDPPYNVKIDGNVCGSGAVKHREFAMASGEMTREEFTQFLTGALDLARAHASPGSIIYACMDWRHMAEMLAAGDTAKFELLNLCVWVKTNGGMGSLYRSRHELVFVFRNGGEAIATTSNSAGSAEIGPTFGTTPAPAVSRTGAEATSTCIRLSNRSPWSPTPSWIQRISTMSSSTLFSVAGRPCSPHSAREGDVMASNSIRCMSIRPSCAGSA